VAKKSREVKGGVRRADGRPPSEKRLDTVRIKPRVSRMFTHFTRPETRGGPVTKLAGEKRGGRQTMPETAPASAGSQESANCPPATKTAFRSQRWLSAVVAASAALGLSTSLATAAQPKPASLAERFADPPPAARLLKIIHSWPETPVRQDDLIRSLQAQGFGGVVCNVSFEDYLESETQWAAFKRAVTAAQQAGLTLWLYDEKGYPSGNAGGLVLRDHPAWEARGLLATDVEAGAGPVELTVPPGRLFLAAAFPLREGRLDPAGRVDLAAQVRDQRLAWLAPEGRWRVLALTEATLYEGTHAEGNLWQKLPYPNLLDAPPTARFLELTHARYARELGPDLGRYFVATFTDEPSLMSWFVRRMPYRPLPWSATLSAEFRQRRGYALESIVPALVVEGWPAAQHYRYDFWRTVGELVAENFCGQIQHWCRRHGVRSGGHLLAEEGLTAHVPLYGDFFGCLRRLDAPGIDCLTSLPPEVPWHIARLAASAAELEGQPLVMCETSDHSQVYRPAGDARPKRIVTEAEIRGTCNRLLVGGVNVITSYYSFTDLKDDALRRLNAWVGRCATLLTGGHQVADVAVVYPLESLWTRFLPAAHWANASPAANQIDHFYRTALESLFATRRDCTVIDSRALIKAEVAQGELVHGPLRWRLVVLPGVDTLPWAAWQRLAEFVRAGGTVIALGARPANSESQFPDSRVQAWAELVFGPSDDVPISRSPTGRVTGVFLRTGAEAVLPAMVDRLLEPDVTVADPHAPVRVTHRRIDGHEVYFLINDSARPWAGNVTCRATGAAAHWDPATGRILAWTNTADATLALEPYRAALLRFAGPARAPQETRPESLPSVSLRDLPAAQPSVARGEFVRETFQLDAEFGRESRPAWRAQARLLRGEVDTFLFVRFPFPDGLDLSGADLLELESSVPAGQSAPTQLLVILQEQDGGDFLVSTPRSLATPGIDRCFLSLDRLPLAGWSKDADGLLDRRRIAELRIGWGGYFGRESETVEFSVKPPRAAIVTPRP
jgi:hypothetical protein